MAVGAALVVDGGERHGRRLGNLGRDGLFEPGAELLQGIGIDVALVQAPEGVVIAEVCDVHDDATDGTVPAF
jgi:hypothetical protein